MAAISALARPYARAAFSQAKQESAVAAWGDALEMLAILVQSPQIAGAITNPNVATSKILDFIMQVGKAANVPLDSGGLCNFVTLMVQDRLLGRIPEIQRQFVRRRYKDEGIVPVVVHSAIKLSSAQFAALEQPVSKLFAANKVELTGKTDPSLLGGLRLQADDRVLDLSLQEKLRRLEQAMA
ncbi:MAG: F0F1 ATP synthase subunit delta [Candidatus Porifericomitaceae bacterium WSBS_2022_MAG_OTU9]